MQLAPLEAFQQILSGVGPLLPLGPGVSTAGPQTGLEIRGRKSPEFHAKERGGG